MIWKKTGEVVPGFHVLGSRGTPSYLWDAPQPVLFDSGLSFLGGAYVRHARAVLGQRQPQYLFLSHAHFDHCGATGALRAAFPQLRVAASQRAGEILQRPRALALIRSLNEDARRLAPLLPGQGDDVPGFEPFAVDRVLGDGDEVDLGQGHVVQVLATPGHTRDFLSYYLPGPKILVASEAAGVANVAGEMMVEFVADYDAYLSSLQRLRTLDIEVLCPGHFQVTLGQDARAYLERSLQATERYRQWVERLLEQERGDVERVVVQVKAAEWDGAAEPKQPLAAYLLNTRARVQHLAQRGAAGAGVGRG